MPDYKPRHRPPDPEVWDAFCDAVGAAAKMLAEQQPAQPPLEDLSPAQYACGTYFAATDQLLRALGAPHEVRDLVALPARAWQHAGWGILDPLFTPALIGGRKAAAIPMTVFRALILKLTDDVAGNSAESWRAAAQTVSSALRRTGAPKGCTPSAKLIQNWHSEATKPPGPTASHLAQAYAHYRLRPWPGVAGRATDEKVRWISAIYRMMTP